MSKVFFSMGVSLDGFSAPAGLDFGPTTDPAAKASMDQWLALHNWMFKQQFFQRMLKLGEGGETGRDNQIQKETFARTGASIMGKRMFDGGELSWPEEAPFHTPVFVLTHEVRTSWERPGGTTFYFVNDGIESALRQAREAAGRRDIRIAGGANIIQQYLNAGMVDEFELHLAPVFLVDGIRLFENIDKNKVKLEVVEAIHSPWVSHLSYRLTNGQSPAE